MQSGFDYQKLAEVKQALVRQGRSITADTMWDVLEKDAKLHGRTLPARKKPKSNPSGEISSVAPSGVVRFDDQPVELTQTSSTEAQTGDAATDMTLSPANMELTAEDIQKVQMLREIIGADEETARQLLIAAHGDVEMAIANKYG